MISGPHGGAKTMTLKQFLEENPRPDDFKSEPRYVADGDYVTHFFSDELCYAERIDDLLTIYLSEDTGDLIGCKIKGVTQLVKKVHAFIELDDGELQMGYLFLSAAGPADVSHVYYELSEKTKTVLVDCREALAAAA
jgi:hypothetical protein